MIIGITGPTGCGKSISHPFFESLGYICIDADTIYHDLTEADSPCSREIIGEFGEAIRNENGGICRKALAPIVFSDAGKLQRLNEITHKYVSLETDSMIRKAMAAKTAGVLLDVPLLFESGFDKKCDITIAVLAEKAERLKRICERDSLSPDDAQKRIDAQPTDSFYLEKADCIVYNNSTIEAFYSSLTKIPALKNKNDTTRKD